MRTIYGADTISERHRHRHEVNVYYRERLEPGELVFSGMSPDGKLPEIVERPDSAVVYRRAVSYGVEVQAICGRA